MSVIFYNRLLQNETSTREAVTEVRAGTISPLNRPTIKTKSTKHRKLYGVKAKTSKLKIIELPIIFYLREDDRFYLLEKIEVTERK